MHCWTTVRKSYSWTELKHFINFTVKNNSLRQKVFILKILRKIKEKLKKLIFSTRKSSCEFIFPSWLTLILLVNSLQTKTQMTHLLFSFVGWHDFLLQHSPSGKKRNMQLFDKGRDESAAGRRSQAKQWWPVSG